jgi:hypothetical protein
MPELSGVQREALLRPIKPRRVLKLDGNSHLPAYDVEAHLTRMFGFEGWDREIVDLWLIAEDAIPDEKRNGRIGWTVTYGCKLRLTVRNVAGAVVKITDGCATGSAKNLPSRGDAHDFAMKNADSYALKRCAKAWGDQFGLSLYNKGQTAALVQRIVCYGDTGEVDHPEPKSMGNDEVDHEITQQDEGGNAALSPPSDPPPMVEPPRAEGGSDGDTPPSDESGEGVNPKQRTAIFASCRAKGLDARKTAGDIVGRPISSMNDLTAHEAHRVLDYLKEMT